MAAVVAGPLPQPEQEWALQQEQALRAEGIWLLVAGESRFEDSEASREASSPALVHQNSSDDDRRALIHGDTPHMASQDPERPLGDPSGVLLGGPCGGPSGCASVAADEAHVVDVDLVQGETEGDHERIEVGTHNEHYSGLAVRIRFS